MAKRPTIADVARAAGTHDSTASRVLNREDFGRPELRARVLTAAASLGYRPNRRAQGLRRARSWTIGLLVSDLGNAAFLPFLRGAQHAADARGYALLVGDGQRSADVERRVLERFFDQGVDGVVIAGPFRATDSVKVLIDHQVPVVPSLLPRERAWHNARIAEEAAATRAMVDRLAALNHRSMLFVSGLFTEPVAGTQYRRARHRPAAEAAHGHGMTFVELAVDPDDVAADAALQFAAMLDDGRMPTAVVSGSHAVTPGLLRALRSVGLSIPVDVSFVTYGDSEWALTHTPPLSVIRRDFYTEAGALMDMVLAAVEHRPRPDLTVGAGAEFEERPSIGEASPE